MFDKYNLRESIWKQNINTFLGSLFLGSCALWAAQFIWNVTWNTDPLTEAFTKLIIAQTTLAE